MAPGIASVTLARLYVQQGYLQRARSMLSQIIARNPEDGAALELMRRLAVRAETTLTIELAEESTALLRWRDAPCSAEELQLRFGTADAALHVILLAFGRGPGTPTFVTSRRCTRARAEVLLPCGPDPGSVSACIALETPAGLGRARPIAVAEPVSWVGAA